MIADYFFWIQLTMNLFKMTKMFAFPSTLPTTPAPTPPPTPCPSPANQVLQYITNSVQQFYPSKCLQMSQMIVFPPTPPSTPAPTRLPLTCPYPAIQVLQYNTITVQWSWSNISNNDTQVSVFPTSSLESLGGKRSPILVSNHWIWLQHAPLRYATLRLAITTVIIYFLQIYLTTRFIPRHKSVYLRIYPIIYNTAQ